MLSCVGSIFLCCYFTALIHPSASCCPCASSCVCMYVCKCLCMCDMCLHVMHALVGILLCKVFCILCLNIYSNLIDDIILVYVLHVKCRRCYRFFNFGSSILLCVYGNIVKLNLYAAEWGCLLDLCTPSISVCE